VTRRNRLNEAIDAALFTIPAMNQFGSMMALAEQAKDEDLIVLSHWQNIKPEQSGRLLRKEQLPTSTASKANMIFHWRTSSGKIKFLFPIKCTNQSTIGSLK
jgi:hypothetical protein